MDTTSIISIITLIVLISLMLLYIAVARKAEDTTTWDWLLCLMYGISVLSTGSALISTF